MARNKPHSHRRATIDSVHFYRPCALARTIAAMLDDGRAASGEHPTYEEIADAEELAAILHETIIKLSDRAAG